MGMAATQARFLSLTARKSNIEFQGQQINQQRTTLSNQSANYYSELCNMTVPTPPSVDDYTKVSYTFNDGAMNNTITTMLTNPNSKKDGVPYLLSYVQQWQDDYAPVEAATSFVNKTDGVFSVGSTKLVMLGSNYSDVENSTYTFAGINYIINKDSASGKYYINRPAELGQTSDLAQCSAEDIANFEYYNFTDDFSDAQRIYKSGENTFVDDKGNAVTPKKLVISLHNPNVNDKNYATQIVTQNEDGTFSKEVTVLSDEQLKTASAKLTQENAYKYLLNDKYNGGDQSANWYVRYVTNTSTGVEVPYFYKEADLNNENKYTTEGYANINCYTIGSTIRSKQVLNQPGTVERDSSGRYISITIYGKNDDGSVNLNSSITYPLTTNTTTDEDAYNDALNEYNYQQAQYEQKIQDLNSKLEIVHQQDKSLELNLKQLDTEENAIKTEQDAVEKVISKNVEKSFGTFSQSA